MARKEELLVLVLQLMHARAAQAGSVRQAERDLIEFGEMLRRVELTGVERCVARHHLTKMTEVLPLEGDTRNARAYVNELRQYLRARPPLIVVRHGGHLVCQISGAR